MIDAAYENSLTKAIIAKDELIESLEISLAKAVDAWGIHVHHIEKLEAALQEIITVHRSTAKHDEACDKMLEIANEALGIK
jgi:hypothetical protein